ncbi:glutamate decarboxylase [Neurospora crassa]|uniref:Glutamate decarboxylase n=1 Tax=Neurospora crassa (strain ATCC 24698 / 74-OR23-1A / CBS 708.71 / DSM 1257 / FGSC 987) TaxID=367110 RepID=Q7SHX5_NEUCR|nr:glutamate decarboxylase [Neurospora crassa OR74A]EAA36582.3 glutamate decarboxylase [Neurospora crassa OR74A]KHE89782.1 glutamate decarboxylase [Neurospora crassa]|eukprot:XP_965818.3 glutamate decarboxylase [Neurospora crassa OR74A]
MSLSRHVDPEEIIHHLKDIKLQEKGSGSQRQNHLTPYNSSYASQEDIPKYKIPENGTPGDTVYAMLRDELDLDGRPNLNMASFVNTYIEKDAQKLFVENLGKNLSDNDEYPAMISFSDRCVSILAHLWGVQKGEKAIGTATVGSSEAVHLGGLAMKRRWQEKRRAEGKDAYKPNIIMGANAQVALEKFARYFDVEARILPVSAQSNYCLDPALVKENLDENTIGVFVILGSTYTGHYEPVEEIHKILDDFESQTGIDIPIHVDAASGGFVAPFTYAKTGGHKWNFELPRVKSINVSGHKYGLVTPGVGWIVWRDESFLPKHLIFELHYLGGTEYSYTLNFSRPGAQVIVQYYNLIHLGFQGYRAVVENCLSNARLLSKALEATGWYTCVSDIHRPPQKQAGSVKSGSSGYDGENDQSCCSESQNDDQKAESEESKTHASSSSLSSSKDTPETDRNREETSADYTPGLPVVSFRFTDEFQQEYPHVKQETVSLLMRARQWIIPNYALPPNEDQTEILRVVIRESFSFDLIDRLVTDLVSVTETLMENDEVDLSLLQQHQGGRRRPLTKDEKRIEKEEREREERKGEERGEEKGKRMGEGIHRSVC